MAFPQQELDIIHWGLINPASDGHNQAETSMGGRDTKEHQVRITEMRVTDNATLEEFYADEEVAKQLLLPSNEGSWIPEFRKSLKESYDFAILADGKIAGWIRLEDPSRCRSGYRVNAVVGREFWGQGICTEALKQIVRYVFDELDLHKVRGGTDSDNPAAGRVFEKVGFKKEGVLLNDN